MRLWNGWGEADRQEPLGAAAESFLRERLGPAQNPHDVTWEQALAAVPPSRLAEADGFASDAPTRLLHARGQSFPDWLALRTGRLQRLPDAVALPQEAADVDQILERAARLGAQVIPYGGGTSVVGHLQPGSDDRPVLSVSLEKMDRLCEVNERSRLARFMGGTPGPRVEAQLAGHGLMLGHFPQSYDYSTVGGWVVTRSSGQQSLRYGRIEQLFAGGRLSTPRGELIVGGAPASSAGPDLREAVLGSEGRLGILTDAWLRLRALPAREDFHAVFFPSWELGVDAVRRMVQADVCLSMLRLSNAGETETQLMMAGHDKMVGWLRRYLQMRGSGGRPVMLMMGITGSNRDVLHARREALTTAKLCRGVHAGRLLGRAWAGRRFAGPYLRNGLWRAGYGADTVETAVGWPQVTATMQAVENAAREAFEVDNEKVHVFTHISHVYPQGCSLYSTLVFRLATDPDATLERWQRMKRRLSETIVAYHGTISHQHGVGRDHAPYLEAEKGPLGMTLLRALVDALDPQRMMNPGKLIDG